jgi:pimeloyl-ACP methyl ester carboxylesterase
MDTVASHDGTTIAFDRSGEGPSLVFVDGALADRSAGRSLAALLAPRFTVYSYDRRGRGDSTDTAPYAVEREVEDLDALIGEAGGSAMLVGGSSGGVLALEAARTLPVTKLVIYEPPFIVDDSRAPLPDDYVERLRDVASSGRRGEAVEYFMTVGVEVPAEQIAGMRQAPFWAGLESIAHTIAYDGVIMGDTMSGSAAPLQRWASVTIPTLVVDGGASPQWMHNGAQAIADVLPAARRVTLEGQTHAVDPAVLAPVLEEFFST